MARTQQTQNAVCPIARAAHLFGDHWTLLILRDLADGCRRFHELQTSTGMSPGVLSGRLRALDAAGIVTRRQYSEIPPRVEYTLTEKGRAALPLIDQLRSYGETWLSADDATESVAGTTAGAPGLSPLTDFDAFAGCALHALRPYGMTAAVASSGRTACAHPAPWPVRDTSGDPLRCDSPPPPLALPLSRRYPC